MRLISAIAITLALAAPAAAQPDLTVNFQWSFSERGGQSADGSTVVGGNQATAQPTMVLGYGRQFPASSYQFNCSTPYPTSWNMGGSVNGNACRILQAPVVDMDFVSRIRAAGYQVAIAYPRTNFGNSRALLTFGLLPGAAGCTGSVNICDQGIARLEGAGWENQFAPWTTYKYDKYGTTVIGSTTYPMGDGARNYIGTFAASDTDQSVVAFFYGQWKGVPFATGGIVLDEWLTQTPAPPSPPALPPLPNMVGPAGSSDVAFGSSGSASASGAGTSGATANRAGSPFDYVSYCNQPGRTPAWIQNCLANNAGQ